MTDIVHEVRPGTLGATYSYRLGDDGLYWQAGRTNGHIAYADVTRVELITYAAEGETQGQCKLKRRSGKPLRIRTHSFDGLGDLEDRTSTYRPFVRELCKRIAAAAPQARFLSGSTTMWYIWIVLLAVLGTVGVFLLLAILGAPPLAFDLMFGLLVVAGIIPFVWRQIRRGGQNDFDPQDPPAEFFA